MNAAEGYTDPVNALHRGTLIFDHHEAWRFDRTRGMCNRTFVGVASAGV